MLKHVDEIEKYLPPELKKFTEALRKLDLMKKSCFSTSLAPDWEQRMIEFENSYDELGISQIPKSHICFKHVSEFINFTGKSLGSLSEQGFESKWKIFYKFRKIVHLSCHTSTP